LTKFKIGDIVTIQSEDWLEKNCEPYNFMGENLGFQYKNIDDTTFNCIFRDKMLKYCNKKTKIIEINGGTHDTFILENTYIWNFVPWMFKKYHNSLLKKIKVIKKLIG
jgi:hypothetical protein